MSSSRAEQHKYNSTSTCAEQCRHEVYTHKQLARLALLRATTGCSLLILAVLGAILAATVYQSYQVSAGVCTSRQCRAAGTYTLSNMGLVRAETACENMYALACGSFADNYRHLLDKHGARQVTLSAVDVIDHIHTRTKALYLTHILNDGKQHKAGTEDEQRLQNLAIKNRENGNETKWGTNEANEQTELAVNKHCNITQLTSTELAVDMTQLLLCLLAKCNAIQADIGTVRKTLRDIGADSMFNQNAPASTRTKLMQMMLRLQTKYSIETLFRVRGDVRTNAIALVPCTIYSTRWTSDGKQPASDNLLYAPKLITHIRGEVPACDYNCLHSYTTTLITTIHRLHNLQKMYATQYVDDMQLINETFLSYPARTNETGLDANQTRLIVEMIQNFTAKIRNKQAKITVQVPWKFIKHALMLDAQALQIYIVWCIIDKYLPFSKYAKIVQSSKNKNFSKLSRCLHLTQKSFPLLWRKIPIVKSEWEQNKTTNHMEQSIINSLQSEISYSLNTKFVKFDSRHNVEKLLQKEINMAKKIVNMKITMKIYNKMLRTMRKKQMKLANQSEKKEQNAYNHLPLLIQNREEIGYYNLATAGTWTTEKWLKQIFKPSASKWVDTEYKNQTNIDEIMKCLYQKSNLNVDTNNYKNYLKIRNKMIVQYFALYLIEKLFLNNLATNQMRPQKISHLQMFSVEQTFYIAYAQRYCYASSTDTSHDYDDSYVDNSYYSNKLMLNELLRRSARFNHAFRCKTNRNNYRKNSYIDYSGCYN